MHWNEVRNRCNLIRTTLILFYTCVVFANQPHSNTQYILMWTNPHHFTYPFIQKGNKSFVNHQCKNQNCFISYKYTHVAKNLTHYDAILFNAVTLRKKPSIQLPKRHAKNQKYILISAKSAGDFPVTDKYNNFFHWTWTYKLNSDISNAYIAIKDNDGKVIGPKDDMHWITTKKMKDLRTNIISKLQFKTTAAAWIISNCDQRRQYETYIQKFQTELGKYSHSLDILGTCGDNICPEYNIKKCYTLLESKYYFYMSFEDSMAEDYVTDQLLIALNHFAVPLVFGGANYTRFMPEGIYLNALELGPRKLAKKINEIIGNRTTYYDMFKWHNYYSFYNPYDNPDTNGICELCNLLNNKQRREETKVYENIVTWFNDRKDWNLVDEHEKVKIKHMTNKTDQTFNKPESQDVKNNLETDDLSLKNLFDEDDLINRNKQTTLPVFDKSYEDSDDFAEILLMRNIVKNELYNDVGLAIPFLGLGNENEQETTTVDNNEQNYYIQNSAEEESLIDFIKRLEKEDLTKTEITHTTKVFNTQPFHINDFLQFSYAEKTTNKQLQPQTTNKIMIQLTKKKQQQQTTTIKQNNDNIEERLKKENQILKDALKRFEKMIALNEQQFSIRNITKTSETKIYPIEINDTDTREITTEIPQIDTIDKNRNNQNQKRDFENKYNLKSVIRPIEEKTTEFRTKSVTAKAINSDNDNQIISSTEINKQKNQNDSGLLNLLIWTNSTPNPFSSKKMGKTLFIENKCEFQNCIFSNEYSNVTDLKSYEAMIFDAVTLREQPFIKLPQQRDEDQKYILVSRASAVNYPITPKYNNFFNWTWTYKLDSDISFSYIVIKDKDGRIVGPAKEMQWISLENMDETSEEIVRKLQIKTTAAAWIMPDCQTINKYEYYITDLRSELRKYDHVLDVFGECGNMNCLNGNLEECYTLLETEYYFCLSFEDSMAEDYVTDQLLTALNNLVVPLVYGGANYTRFMPDGIYLDALELGPAKLARKISDIIRKRKSYNDMFRWHNYYSYHNPLDEPNASGICEVCALLNDKQQRKERTVYRNIVKWFNDRKDWNIRHWSTTTSEVLITIDEKKKFNRKSYVNRSHLQFGDTDNIYDRSYDYDSAITFDTLYNLRSNSNSFTTRGFENTDVNNMYYAKTIYRHEQTLGTERYSTQTAKPLTTKDTSIRCPDVTTCFNTIVSNVQSKISSLFV